MNTVLVCPLTSQIDALRFPGTVFIEPSAENGLRRNSVVLVFQLTAVDKRFIGDRIGEAESDAVASIWQAFDEITERDL